MKEGNNGNLSLPLPKSQLKPEQRRWLETMVHMGSTPAKHYSVARVPLMSDQSQGQPSHTDGQIAEALTISRRERAAHASGKTDTSRDLVILAKDRRIKELEAENQKFQQQLKVALAKAYEQL